MLPSVRQRVGVFGVQHFSQSYTNLNGFLVINFLKENLELVWWQIHIVYNLMV